MESYALTVFFDGGCPLCRREIEHYRTLKALAPIQWIDATQSDDLLSAHGLDRLQALQRFHVLDASGSFHVGARGFLALWSQLPYYRALSGIVRILHLQSVLDWGYVRFADWHFQRRCRDGVCGVTGEHD